MATTTASERQEQVRGGAESSQGTTPDGGAIQTATDSPPSFESFRADLYDLNLAPGEVTLVPLACDEKALTHLIIKNDRLRSSLKHTLRYVESADLEHRNLFRRFVDRLNPFSKDGIVELLNLGTGAEIFLCQAPLIALGVCISCLHSIDMVTSFAMGGASLMFLVPIAVIGDTSKGGKEALKNISIPSLMIQQIPLSGALALVDAFKTLRRLHDHFSSSPQARGRNALENIRRQKGLSTEDREELRATVVTSLEQELVSLNHADATFKKRLEDCQVQEAGDLARENSLRLSALNQQLSGTGRMVVAVEGNSLETMLPAVNRSTLRAMVDFLHENRPAILEGSLFSVPPEHADIIGLNRPLAAISRAPRTIREQLLDRLETQISAVADAQDEMAEYLGATVFPEATADTSGNDVG